MCGMGGSAGMWALLVGKREGERRGGLVGLGETTEGGG